MKGKSIKKKQGDKEESIESSLEKIRDRKLRASMQRMYEKYKAGNIGAHAEETARDIQKAIAPGGKLPDEQMHIPHIPMPTDLCRVSPFFPMARMKIKGRPYIEDMIITSSSWGDIKYTGPKLSTYDEDALMAVLSILDSAQNRQTTEIKGKKTYTYRGPLLPILNLMGLSSGSLNYLRIKHSLKLMLSAVVELNVYKRTSRGKRKVSRCNMSNMLSVFDWNEEKKELVVTVNPYFYESYIAGSVTLIDVEARSKLKSPIAKCLFRFMQSHRSVIWEGNFFTLASALNLDRNQPDKQIRRQIRQAIKELIQIKILLPKSGFTRKDSVKLIRHPSTTTRQK